MRVRVTTTPSRLGEHLWLQWPDRLDELPVLWIVLGDPDQVGRTVTIPVDLKDVAALVNALAAIAATAPGARAGDG